MHLNVQENAKRGLILGSWPWTCDLVNLAQYFLFLYKTPGNASLGEVSDAMLYCQMSMVDSRQIGRKWNLIHETCLPTSYTNASV